MAKTIFLCFFPIGGCSPSLSHFSHSGQWWTLTEPFSLRPEHTSSWSALSFCECSNIMVFAKPCAFGLGESLSFTIMWETLHQGSPISRPHTGPGQSLLGTGPPITGGELECNALKSSWNHPSPRVWGKIVFHETSPWCQKGWGPFTQYFFFLYQSLLLLCA